MISIHLPKGSQKLDLGKELMSAKKIKDKSVRDSTITGLNKIAHYL